MYSPIKWQAL